MTKLDAGFASDPAQPLNALTFLLAHLAVQTASPPCGQVWHQMLATATGQGKQAAAALLT
jgi:hypothetical protein